MRVSTKIIKNFFYLKKAIKMDPHKEFFDCTSCYYTKQTLLNGKLCNCTCQPNILFVKVSKASSKVY